MRLLVVDEPFVFHRFSNETRLYADKLFRVENGAIAKWDTFLERFAFPGCCRRRHAHNRNQQCHSRITAVNRRLHSQPGLLVKWRCYANNQVCRPPGRSSAWVRFGMSSDRITAIDPDRSTGNEVRSPRGQVHSRSRKFLRLTPSTGGSSPKNFVVQGH
jgi:hypothetical protein